MASKIRQFIDGEDLSVIVKNSPAQPPKDEEPAPPPKSDIPVVNAPLKEGLSVREVEERTNGGLSNVAGESAGKSVKEIIHSNVFTYFNYIFIVLAIIMFIVGAWRNTMFLFVVVGNTLIGIIQELRSKRAVDKLSILAEGEINAIRSGKRVKVKTSHLVRDDIVEFRAGDQIPADAILRYGEVDVNESLLTGESDSIPKKQGDELKSGSSIVSGKCLAQLTRVGSDSYASRLTQKAKEDAGVGKSEMMASLDKLIKFIGISLIPVGIALFVRQLLTQDLSVYDYVTSTVAALLGMIPEGLYLLTSVALALSVMRLSSRKVLVRDMNCVETLARVDTLCVDKTGTITEPGMNVEEVISISEDEQVIRDMLYVFYSHMDADNDTAIAMKEYFTDSRAGEIFDSSSWNVRKVIPFSSERKWSGITFSGKGTYLVGAPEFIMGGAVSQISDFILPYTEKGYRVLLVARLDEHNYPIPMGAVVISNRIRNQAPETFRYFADQGVTVKVISGDNPSTVSQVAKLAGIENADRFLDARTLDTDEKIAAAAEEYTVFGRVTPSQKLALVKALQAKGHTVAMTGDGVNDVLALKEADCGIAMASGSQAASQISQLVLLNSDFASMPSIVAEGRRVINNIQRSASLFLVKNLFSFAFALIAIFAAFPYPMQPNQLSLVSALTIGIPGFFLAMQPNSSRVKGHFLGNVILKALPGGLTDIALLGAAEAFFYTFNLGMEKLYSIAPIVMLTVGLSVLWKVCQPMDTFRKILWSVLAAVSALLVIITPYTFLKEWIAIERLDLESVLILIVLMALSYPLMMLFSKVIEGISLAVKKVL